MFTGRALDDVRRCQPSQEQSERFVHRPRTWSTAGTLEGNGYQALGWGSMWVDHVVILLWVSLYLTMFESHAKSSTEDQCHLWLSLVFCKIDLLLLLWSGLPGAFYRSSPLFHCTDWSRARHCIVFRPSQPWGMDCLPLIDYNGHQRTQCIRYARVNLCLHILCQSHYIMQKLYKGEVLRPSTGCVKSKSSLGLRSSSQPFGQAVNCSFLFTSASFQSRTKKFGPTEKPKHIPLGSSLTILKMELASFLREFAQNRFRKVGPLPSSRRGKTGIRSFSLLLRPGHVSL